MQLIFLVAINFIPKQHNPFIENIVLKTFRKMSNLFQLPDDYAILFPGQFSRAPKGISASMKAAADPDPRVLQAVLVRHRESADNDVNNTSSTFGPNSTVDWPGQQRYNTPLLQAIRSQLPQNVKTLLEADANRNGMDFTAMKEYQALFLRFRPSIPSFVDIDGDVADRETILKCMELPQTSPITTTEVEDRSRQVTPFWMMAEYLCVDRYPGGDEMHSLIAAARHPSIAIFDQVMCAGADALCWNLESNPCDTLEEQMSLDIAIWSPLHAAVEAKNVSMLSHLLSLGFDPSFVPTSTLLTCLTPFMSTFLTKDTSRQNATAQAVVEPIVDDLPKDFNLAAYSAFHPIPEYTLTTPILSIHPYHLTVAHASLPLLQHVMRTLPVSPADIAPTALGHTLLHIACLPLTADHIKRNSLAVVKSIHDTREMSLPRIRVIEPVSEQQQSPPSMPAIDEDYHEAQNALVEFLILTMSQNISDQDIFGNTALHYLASHTVPNTSSISFMHDLEGREKVWTNSRNQWGYTPEDLFDAQDPEEEVQAWRNDKNRELRMEQKKRDAWWSCRIAKEHGRVARGGWTIGRGRRGGGCRDCGRRIEEHDEEFPYHVRGASK